MKTIKLTDSQVDNLIEFLELELIPSIPHKRRSGTGVAEKGR